MTQPGSRASRAEFENVERQRWIVRQAAQGQLVS
jgi:hypothetical protein